MLSPPRITSPRSKKKLLTTDNNNSSSNHHPTSSNDFVKVFLRIRPLNDRENLDDTTVIPWQYSKKQIRSFATTHGAQRTTSFDAVLAPDMNQKETYQSVAEPIVKSCMEGFNGMWNFIIFYSLLQYVLVSSLDEISFEMEKKGNPDIYFGVY